MNWQKDKLTIIGFGIIFVILGIFGYLLLDMNKEPITEVSVTNSKLATDKDSVEKEELSILTNSDDQFSIFDINKNKTQVLKLNYFGNEKLNTLNFRISGDSRNILQFNKDTVAMASLPELKWTKLASLDVKPDESIDDVVISQDSTKLAVHVLNRINRFNGGTITKNTIYIIDIQTKEVSAINVPNNDKNLDISFSGYKSNMLYYNKEFNSLEEKLNSCYFVKFDVNSKQSKEIKTSCNVTNINRDFTKAYTTDSDYQNLIEIDLMTLDNSTITKSNDLGQYFIGNSKIYLEKIFDGKPLMSSISVIDINSKKETILLDKFSWGEGNSAGQISVSPDEKYLIINFSSSDIKSKLFKIDNNKLIEINKNLDIKGNLFGWILK